MRRRRHTPTSMKHLRSKWLLLLVLLASATSLSAQTLQNLDIRVVLSRNGDAHITETRQMDIDWNGTECYIVIGNLDGSELRDFTVTDETGRHYEYEEFWDVDEDRDWKEGKCGINQTSNGYELCWGLGEEGDRTYITSYTVTNLVKGFNDADGFNYMFVAQGINPYPEHVKLTIVAEDDSTFISPENTGIWAFRYRGDISFVGNSIVAESSEPFESRSAMIVMCRFEKGMFEPMHCYNNSFEDLKQRAFEGSDYDDSDYDWEGILMLVFFVIAFVVIPVITFVSQLIIVWYHRRKVNKNLLWYRDIPYKGNLHKANDVLNAYRYFGSNYNNLLSACILKLINMGAISIEQRLNDKGQTEQNFVIHELENYADQPLLLRKIHQMFKIAAGEDTVLEPRELKSYMKSSKNQGAVESFISTLHTKTGLSAYKNSEEVRQVFGLRKFLKEFSLLDERHVNEVSLWKDYMIYATLFGIADQVIKDMKKINPEYFNMDQVAAQMADNMTLPMIYSTLHSGTSRAVAEKAAREARASGRGGHSSWGGGGGGFSGGGGGGGVR